MITCKKCNAPLEAGARFCTSCGTLVVEPKHCRNCGNTLGDGVAFCQSCGTPVLIQTSPMPGPMLDPISGSMPGPMPGPISGSMPGSMSGPMPGPMPGPISGSMPGPMTGPIPSANATNKSKKLLPIILISIAAIAVIAILAVMVPKILFNRASNQLVYLKGDELNCSSLSKIKPIEITDNLYKDGTIEESDAYTLDSYIATSKNGKRIFYPDQVSDSDDDITLYYKDINKKNSKGVKIDSNIKYYYINDTGTKIYYVKGVNFNLYVSDFKDKEMIDSGVENFFVNSKGTKVVYVTADGVIYSKDGSKDKKQIDSSSTLQYVEDDLNIIYYLKDSSTLYIKKWSEDPVQVDTKVDSCITAYESGEIYYLKVDTSELTLEDFVNDDLKDSDAAMVEPMEPSYPDYNSYKPSEGYPIEPAYDDYIDYDGYIDWNLYDQAYSDYNAAVDTYNSEWNRVYNEAVDAYNVDYETYTQNFNEYSLKLNRDSIRASMAESTIPTTKYMLYYYDLNTSTMVTDSYSTYDEYSFDLPVMIYKNYNVADFAPVNISEVTSYDELYTKVTDSMYAPSDTYVAFQTKTTLLKQGDSLYDYDLAPSGKSIYYLDSDADEESGDLYQIKMKGDKLETAIKIDEDVNQYQFAGAKDTLLYYKNIIDDAGDLYKNGEKIDSDVSTYYSAYEVNNSEDLIYYVGYDSDKESGTLTLYDGKNTKKIADDVHAFTDYKKNCIAYLSDYDYEHTEGELYLYEGSKKDKKVDEDVMAIVNVYSGGYYGDYDYSNY